MLPGMTQNHQKKAELTVAETGWAGIGLQVDAFLCRDPETMAERR